MENERKSRYELFLEEEARKAQPTKRCAKCKEVKALIATEFHRNAASKDGFNTYCRTCRRISKHKSRADQFWKCFWSRTVKVGNCLEWGGTYGGRGNLPIYRWDNKRESVRRIVYRLSCGHLPDDMFVTVSCNNLRCVRQLHLVAITAEEVKIRQLNSAPIGERHGWRLHPERVPKGEQVRTARLTEEDVRRIRVLHGRGLSGHAIAKEFNVDATTVNCLLRGETWKHVQ